jgi:hypothetical protein
LSHGIIAIVWVEKKTIMNYVEYKVDVPEGVSGNWRVEKFVIQEDDPNLALYALDGRPVEPGAYTRLIHNESYAPMMSDTAYEIQESLHFIDLARGRVLINGLGLGVVVKALLKKPEVTRIDVVELEQDIIDLVAPTYHRDIRFKVYQGDAFTFRFPKGTTWDFAWHDIWPFIRTDNLEEITKLKRRYINKACYQEAWVEHELRKLRRCERGCC